MAAYPPVEFVTSGHRDGVLESAESDPPAAIDWLEKAYEIRDPQLVFLASPEWMSLRPHPRFQEILRRMKLPVYPAASGPG